MRGSRVVKELGLKNTVFEEVVGPKGMGACGPVDDKVYCWVARGSDESVYWHEGCHAFFEEIEENRNRFDRDVEELVCDFFGGLKVGRRPAPCSEGQERLLDSADSFAVFSRLLGASFCVPGGALGRAVGDMVSRFPDLAGMYEVASDIRGFFDEAFL